MKKTFTKVMLVRLTLILHVATATMAVYSIDWNGTSATTGGSGGRSCDWWLRNSQFSKSG